MRKRQFLAALSRCDGVVTDATTATGIAASTHYDWLKADPKYAADVDLLLEALLDKAEKVVESQLELGDSRFTSDRALALRAAMEILNAKGKRRGYGQGGAAVTVNNQMGEGSTLKQLIQIQKEYDEKRKEAEHGKSGHSD